MEAAIHEVLGELDGDSWTEAVVPTRHAGVAMGQL